MRMVAMARSTADDGVLDRLGLLRPKEQLRQDFLLKQRSPAWHKRRALLLTASDCAMALGKGYSPGDHANNLLLYKTGRKERAVTSAMQHGIENESRAALAYSELLAAATPGHTVRLRETGLHVHPHHPYLGASFDRIVELYESGNTQPYSVGVVQLKCPKDIRAEMHQVVEVQAQVELAIAAAWDLRGTDDSVAWLDVFEWTEARSKLHPRLLYTHQQQYRWQQELLPTLTAFYFKRLAPGLLSQQQAVLPAAPGAPAAAAAIASPSAPPTRQTERITATVAAAPNLSPIPGTSSPSVAVGKWVTSNRRGADIGQVTHLGPQGVKVRWRDSIKSPVPMTATSLCVYPLDPSVKPVQPSREGQPVVVLRGTYGGRHGITTKQTGAGWHIDFVEDGVVTRPAPKPIPADLLHAKAAPDEPSPEPVRLI
jgi:hypothetical protein